MLCRQTSVAPMALGHHMVLRRHSSRRRASSCFKSRCNLCAGRCRDCSTLVHKPKTMQNHSVVAWSADAVRASPAAAESCERHNQPFKLFCATCRLALCAVCLRSPPHLTTVAAGGSPNNQHAMQPLVDAVRAIKSQLVSLASESRALSTQLERELERLSSLNSVERSSVAESERAIAAAFKAARAAIDRRELALGELNARAKESLLRIDCAHSPLQPVRVSLSSS